MDQLKQYSKMKKRAKQDADPFKVEKNTLRGFRVRSVLNHKKKERHANADLRDTLDTL